MSTAFFAYLHRHDHRKPPKTKSGYKGVYHITRLYNGRPFRKPYKAYIRQHGQYIVIGHFATGEEAAAAYNKVALRLKGANSTLTPSTHDRPIFSAIGSQRPHPPRVCGCR